MSIYSIFTKIDSFLRIPPNKNPIDRVKTRFLGILIIALIPAGLMNAVVVRVFGNIDLWLCWSVAVVAPIFLLTMRAGAPQRIVALAFGLFMELLLSEGIYRLSSAVSVTWMGVVPFMMILVGDGFLGAYLAIIPSAYVFLGIIRFTAAEPAALGPLVLRLTEGFSASPGADLFSYGLFIVVMSFTSVLFNRLTLDLYRKSRREHARMVKSLKALEEKQQTIAEQLRLRELLFDIIPVPLFIKDADYRYVACSRAYLELTGLAGKEVIGRTVHDLFPPEVAEKSDQAEQKLARTGGLQYYYTTITRSSEDVREILVQKTFYPDASGAFAGIIGVAIDQTERLKKERDLRNLLEARRDTMALVGHDLKGPLGAFRDLLEIMTTDECVESNDMHTVIMELGRKMTMLWKLMNELVDWASIEDDEDDFIPDDHPAAALLEEVRDFIAEEAERKGLSLTIGAHEGLVIHGDRRMLSAVLRNLTANAVKFTERGGTIAVTAAAAPGGTELVVSDTGIGMEETTVHAFMAAGDIRSRRGTEGELGSGLGLRLCRRLIERHRGTMKIESALGVGTTFTAFFPDRGQSPIET